MQPPLFPLPAGIKPSQARADLTLAIKTLRVERRKWIQFKVMWEQGIESGRNGARRHADLTRAIDLLLVIQDGLKRPPSQ